MQTALLWFSAVAVVSAHKPGFLRSGRTHYFSDTELSQAEYRGPGTHRFAFNCTNLAPNTPQNVFWEVVVPWPSYASLTVTFNESKMTSDPATTRSTSATCPVKRYREGWTATQVGSMVRFGSAPCTQGRHEVHVHSAGPMAFVIGEDEDWRDMNMGYMPWYYYRVGMWAGWGSGLALIALVLVLLAVYKWNTHTAIGLVWVVFLLVDFFRWVDAMSGQTRDTCAAQPNNAAGPTSHDDDDTGTATTIALYVARLATVLAGLALLYAHMQPSPCARAWIPIAAAGIAAVAWLLGVGLGIWGVILVLYYAVDETTRQQRKWEPTYLVLNSKVGF